MTQQRTFVRKMIYVAVIAVLLVPLYLLSHPETQKGPGGKLARLRSDYGLSEAELGGIDPASSTAKLATFGMRGVATTLLWDKAQDYQRRKLWTELDAVLKQIMLLEPHFVAVWENQTWNLSYNVSAEFDDYRERYRWVTEGINFGIDGTRYNQQSAKLPWYVGWVISQKIGRADEKKQFRRLFREDDEFHEKHNTPTREDRDNWLLGKQWFLHSEDMVDNGADIGKKSMVVFYSRAPMCQMNHAEAIEEEGIFGEKARQQWSIAEEEWREYGTRQVPSTKLDEQKQLIKIALSEEETLFEELTSLDQQLKDLQPGFEQQLLWEKWGQLADEGKAAMKDAFLYPNYHPKSARFLTQIREKLDEESPDWQEQYEQILQSNMSEEELDAWKTAPKLRTERQQQLVDSVESDIYDARSRAISLITVTPGEIARRIEGSAEVKQKASEIAEEIDRLVQRLQIVTSYRGLVSFEYWLNHSNSEQEAEALEARELIFNARKKYYAGDVLEANAEYIEGLSRWNDLMKKEGFEYLSTSERFTEDLMDLIERYVYLLETIDEQFPEDFPLADLVRKQVESRDSERLSAARTSMQQGVDAWDAGDYETAENAFAAACDEWSVLFAQTEYLKLMADRELGNEALDTVNRYAQCLERRGAVMPDGFLFEDFVRSQISFDKHLAEAQRLQMKADTELQASQLADAQADYEAAIENWQQLLDRFQCLIVGFDDDISQSIRSLLENYNKTLVLRGQDVPEQPPLKRFIDAMARQQQAEQSSQP